MSYPSLRLKLQSEERKGIKRKRAQLNLDFDYDEPMPDKQTVLRITERKLRTYPEERRGMPLLRYVQLMNTIRLLEKKRTQDIDLSPEVVVNEFAEFSVAQSRQENLSKQGKLPNINSFLSATDVSNHLSRIEYRSSDPLLSDSSTETDEGVAPIFGRPDSFEYLPEILPFEVELMNYGNTCFEDPGYSHMTELSSQGLFTSQDGSCLENQGGSDITELLPATQLAQSQDILLSAVQSSSFSPMHSCTQLNPVASTPTSEEMTFDATMPISSPVSSDVYPIPPSSVSYVHQNPEASASTSAQMAFDTLFLPSILPHYYNEPTPFNAMDYNRSSPPASTGHDLTDYFSNPSVNLVAENENSESSQGPNDSGLNLAEADASLFFNDSEFMDMIDNVDWNETAD